MNWNNEPLTQDNDDRYVLSPINYPVIWDYYKKMNALFWDTDVISMTNDYNNFTKLGSEIQNFIKQILAFFAASDGIVNENVQLNLLSNIQVPEIKAFYAAQMHNEIVHSRTYALLLEEYIPDSNERFKLLKAIQHYPMIKKKADFAFKYMRQSNSLAEVLVAFAVVEGLMFSTSFCAIYWLKHKAMGLDGLIQSNEYIARDEGLHYTFAVYLYNNYIINKLPVSRVIEMVLEGLDVEIQFVESILPSNLEGMNSTLMSNYAKFVASKILSDFNCPAQKMDNPFPWMETISMENKTNFFEKRVTEYQSATILKTDNFTTESTDF